MKLHLASMLVLVVCLLAAGALPAEAYWSSSPVPVCTTAVYEPDPQVVTDGSGGSIVVWDQNNLLYAQRIDWSGSPLWPDTGVVICSDPASKGRRQIIADGYGGAILVWEDYRNGGLYMIDIYAQRVDAYGNVPWAAEGVEICAEDFYQEQPIAVSDGQGGAIIVWRDLRGAVDYHVYAQRIDKFGSVQWTAGGLAVSTTCNVSGPLAIAADDSGGAIILYTDDKNDQDLYAQRISGSGTLLWSPGGELVCGESVFQYAPVAVPDDFGGAVVAWFDGRYQGLYGDIFAQRIDRSGSIQWPAAGVPVCTTTDTQGQPRIATDMAGGAIIVWQDSRTAGDYYAQRVAGSGEVQWTPDGIPICLIPFSIFQPSLASDGAGGAIFIWHAYLSSTVSHVYGQRLDPNGNLLWEPAGKPISTGAANHVAPALGVISPGRFLVAWADSINFSDYDIYAQGIERSGNWGFPTPVIHSALDVPGDQGGALNLTWDASGWDPDPTNEITEYSVWRALSAVQAANLVERGVKTVTSPAGLGLAGPGPVIRTQRASLAQYYWELIGTQTAYHFDGYGLVVETLFDSTATCSDRHYFQVVAHTSDPYVYFTSSPDSGYSVDNLSPAPPQGMAGEQEISPEGLTITWDANTEQDLAGYALYRGISEDFTPGPGNLLGSPTDTVTFDGGWLWNSGYYYKLAAVDIHGNHSVYALLSPEDVTGAGHAKFPRKTFLLQNHPNPFNPATRIEFGLESSALVTLRVYDVSGKLVRSLCRRNYPAGRYTEVWDGRDDLGRRTASGVYLYRLEAGEFVDTKKMVMIK